MLYVLICAAGIAMCCLIGAVLGFFLEEIPPRLEDGITGAAAGIMLCAAVQGLIAPAVESSGGALWIPAFGIMLGALFLSLLERLSPELGGLMGMTGEGDARARAVVFVAAMAIHHFPEGIAAGVSFGTGNAGDIITVTSSIAVQNIPECMIIIPPLLKCGSGRRRAALVAAVSGGVEVLGVFFGYFAVSLSCAILPYALSFAAGTMLFVICDDMLPQSHRGEHGRLATYTALIGFSLMLCLSLAVSYTDF